MAIKECVERLKPLIIALEKTEDAINTTETRGNPIYAVNDIKMASRAIDLATRIKDGIPEEELSEIKKHLLEAREAAYARAEPRGSEESDEPAARGVREVLGEHKVEGGAAEGVEKMPGEVEKPLDLEELKKMVKELRGLDELERKVKELKELDKELRAKIKELEERIAQLEYQVGDMIMDRVISDLERRVQRLEWEVG